MSILVAALVALSALSMTNQPRFTTDDTREAIRQASDNHGVSENFLTCIVRRESTFDPYAIGAHGEQGAVQILPGGDRYREFFGMGYTSTYDPYQAVDYLAISILRGLGPHWSGWRACIA